LPSNGPSHWDFILRPLVSTRTSFFGFISPTSCSRSRCARSRSHLVVDFSRSHFPSRVDVRLVLIKPPPDLVFFLRCHPRLRHKCFFLLGALRCVPWSVHFSFSRSRSSLAPIRFRFLIAFPVRASELPPKNFPLSLSAPVRWIPARCFVSC
jgi:hypothetical protein